MRKFLAVSSVAFALAACQPQGPTGVVPVVASAPTTAASQRPASAPAELRVELDSPDRAVKTWWRWLDEKEKVDHQFCLQSADQFQLLLAPSLRKIASDAVLLGKEWTRDLCTLEVFAREIQNVNRESETRAVVSAVARNSTSIPAGVEPHDFQRKTRAEGVKFRYVLEKSGESWLLTQVYMYDEGQTYLKKDPWRNIYSDARSPSYPYMVLHQ
jgi:hypothetical protein